MTLNYDVIIIGSGPAGIAAAHGLRKRGIRKIAIIERESQAGGVPRHCQHPTFGLLVYKRPMNGHHFVKRILSGLGETEILTNTTVIKMQPDGKLTVSTPTGLVEMQAKRVLIATGVRETPRHARLVSGLRPQGVLTTGALQQFVYLNHQKPCRNPVIIGSELVSFSALWTLKNAGVKAKAIIESNPRITAYRPASLFAKIMGTPVYLETKIVEIGGLERVEYVIIERLGKQEKIVCDAVIFTGKFTGEYTLIRKSHLAYDLATGRPLTDQSGRCSDPVYYAAGNMLHPADMGDQCYQEGELTGLAIADDLLAHHHQSPPVSAVLPIELGNNIRLSVPAGINPMLTKTTTDINIRVNQSVTGLVKVTAGGVLLYQKRHRCLPERRIMLKNIALNEIPSDTTAVEITIVSSR